jgi:uncharacterized protein (TIGR02246 family)
MRRVGATVAACGMLAVFVAAEAKPGVCYLDPGAAFAAPVLAIDQAGSPGTRAADEAQILQALRQYDAAVLAMNAEAVAAFYLPDGEMWDQGKLARKGPEAIRAFLKSFDGQVWVESQQTTVDRISWQGPRAIVETTYRQGARILATQARVDAHGHIRFEWVQDRAGAWRIARAETTPS